MTIGVARAHTSKEHVLKIEMVYSDTRDLACASVGPEVKAAGPTTAFLPAPQG